MPNALAIRGKTLYVADGGDNAIAEVDLDAGLVSAASAMPGISPWPSPLAHDGRAAYVLNTKGNGSVSKTILGLPGNAHDFQGTVTVVDLASDLERETALVARNNHWNASPGRPDLKVYNGGIKHVLYIIKENRTYDEIFGDLPIGNGDPKLCSLGEKVMPNHRKIVREFTLHDNGYVTGTNSADGHNWATQCLANDYLEHFYVGYSRTYPDDGDDSMAISNGGALWDAAAAKGKSIRVYGEFCDNDLARFDPMPKDWFEVWEDRKHGGSPVQDDGRHDGRVAEAVHQSRGPLLAAAAKRPASRRCLHSRVPGIQPPRHHSRPDDHEPSLRPFRGRRSRSIPRPGR